MSQAPLDATDRDRIFAAANGSDLVLVGGQAVEAWARYLNVRALQSTGDVDFQGSAHDAKWLAAGLRYHLQLPESKDLTSLVGVLKFTDSTGIQRFIDVLVSPHGLATDDVKKHALRLEMSDGAELRLMHPADCVISKLSNLSLPNKQRPADRVQAELSLQLAEAYFSWVFAGEFRTQDAERYRHHADRLHAFALSGEGQHAFVHHGLDSFDVVRPRVDMDADFRDRLYPRMRAELDRLQSKIAPRHHAVGKRVRESREGELRPLRYSDRGRTFVLQELVGGAHDLVVISDKAGGHVCASLPSRQAYSGLKLGETMRMDPAGRLRSTQDRGRSRG